MEISIAAFLIALVAFWYSTGRFFIVGWMVKIIWLPINILCALLWVIAVIINTILDFIRASKLFRFIMFGLLAWNAYAYSEAPESLVYIAPFSIAVFLILKFGLNDTTIKRWIFTAPQARKSYTPQPKKTKLQKEFESDKNKKLLPPPIVQIVPKNRGKFETFAQLQKRLEHQQTKQLGGKKPEAETAEILLLNRDPETNQEG